MSERDKKDFGNDDFWNLDGHAPKTPVKPNIRHFSKDATEAVEIQTNDIVINTYLGYSDSKLSKPDDDSGVITRFIPPLKDSVYSKNVVLFEYQPENPFIKNVSVCSDKPDDKLFPDSNLFIRERRVILGKKAQECAPATYYSYFPRYSQMNRAQLSWYLWWRENVKNGIYLKTDESYVTLYAYELATAGDGEDKTEALEKLCALLLNYTDKNKNLIFCLMLRDLIFDFCLVHGINAPLHLLRDVGKVLFLNMPLQEFFMDFSKQNRENALDIGISTISVYDFTKSKIYSDQSASLMKNIINRAIEAIFSDEDAFNAIFSSINGVCNSITVERKPFSKLTNIVNRNIKLKITYCPLSNVQPLITNAVRYAENRLREHLGIKNKLNLMSVNPSIKSAIDRFFDENYPAMPVIDKRRKAAKKKEAEEVYEYEKLYDVPKTEISPERALEIERESWSTTKILTEAFSEEIPENSSDIPSAEIAPEPIQIERSYAPIEQEEEFVGKNEAASNSGLTEMIKANIGDIADFIKLCISIDISAQKAFAATRGSTVDEIADRINEAAVDCFGDIILEDVGGAYGIIEDYVDQL